MSTYNTYAVLADGGGGGELNDDTTMRILQAVHEKEDQFEQLTRDLEVERKAVSNQIEKYRLGSDTTTLSSISSTNNSFHWRPVPPDAILEEGSDLNSRGGSPQLIDSCLQVLSNKNNSKMSAVDYGQRQNYHQTAYSSSSPSWQQQGSRNSLDRGIPANSAAVDRRDATNDEYLVAVPNDRSYSRPNQYATVTTDQRGPQYAADLDSSVPLQSYANVDNDNMSLDRYIPIGNQFAPQQPKNYTDYRGNAGYAPSESDRSSDRGATRQPVSVQRGNNFPNRTDANTNLSNSGHGRYLEMDGSVRGSVHNDLYDRGNQQQPSGDGYITRSVMNDVSVPAPASPNQFEGQPHFTNRGYVPDSDQGYRPNDSYGSTTPKTRQQYPNNAFDPEPEYNDMGYAPNNSRPMQPVYSTAGYVPDNDAGYRPTPIDDRNYLQDSRLNNPTNVGHQLNSPRDTTLAQPAANRPYDGQGIPPVTQGDGGTWRNPDLQEVIDFLSHPSNAVKVNAAAHLQHLSYMNDGIKGKIGDTGGIPPLVALLSHDMPEVQRAACGALRNLSYGRANDDNKRAIRNADGLRALVRLLRQSTDNDIRELVTGILWNMSSCQDLKRPIIDNALTTLVEGVVIPHSSWDGRMNVPERMSDVYWTTVFRNTSGVLRNVSSDGSYSRKRLRECSGLVDSIVSILKAAIGKNDIDNKSVENLVCLMRNLSYACQETADPEYLSKRINRDQSSNQESSTNCFGKNKKKDSKSEASTNSNSQSNASLENRGMQLLWNPLIVKVYQPILSECTNPETLEAAAGALQNLAACDWQPSVELRAAVRKEKCLPVLVELLSLEADFVVRSAATALRNLAIDERNKELIGKYAMRQLVSKLPERRGAPVYPVSDDTIAAVEAAIYEVIRNNIQFAQSFFFEGGVDRLIFMNECRHSYSPRVVKFTQLLLTAMWRDFNGLHEDYKKKGYTEQQFITKSNNNKQGATSVSNTMTRPQMNQGASSYSQRTPQPISRHPVGGTSLPPDAYNSFTQPDYQPTSNNVPDRNWQNNPQDEQVPLSLVRNYDAVLYSPSSQQGVPMSTYDDNRYARVDNSLARYPADEVNTSLPHYQPADASIVAQPHQAVPRYQTAASDAQWSDDLAVGYQPANYGSNTQARHNTSSNSLRPSDMPDKPTQQQEPIYSHVSRPIRTSSQPRLDQGQRTGTNVDSWV